MRRCTVVLLSVLFFAGCNAAEEAPRPAVVVLATPQQEAGLLEQFSAFTAATRIPVTLRLSDSATNTRSVIENLGTPAADVLITAGVADIWRAADEGALRPLTAAAFAEVPVELKDPDRTWAPLAVHYAMIVVAADAEADLVNDYGDFASAELRGKTCLSSSSQNINRALIAMLMEDLGSKPAERLVRAWVKNLAASPFATEAQLVAALHSGQCAYGIVSSAADIGDLQSIAPSPVYLNIDAVGVARHAAQPESAQALVEWLLDAKPVAGPAASNGRNVGLAGWHDDEVRLLAERAGYR